jgi:predicted NUDIX family NTP pyrophosphohydrolase
MKKTAAISAGLLLFRRTAAGLEVFLAHPGGPFWANKDDGAWTIPKGLVDDGEDLLAAARREFEEETGFRPQGPFHSLGSVTQKAGKQVHAWACEGDADATQVKSNDVRLEWPPRSGSWITFPEVDRCAWFDVATAKQKMNKSQAEFLDRLAAVLPNLSGSEPQ